MVYLWRLVLVLVVVPFVAEFAARWWIRSRGRLLLNYPGLRGVYRLVPELSPLLTSPVRYTVNSHGARGGPQPLAAARVFRVTLVGGSAAECRTLPDEECLTGRLNRRFNEPAVLEQLGFEAAYVHSFAASLVDGGALLEVMQATLPQLPRQNAIVLITGGSDAIRWLLAGAPPGRPAPPLPRAEYLAEYPEMLFSWRSPALRHITKRIAFSTLGYTQRDEIGRYPVRERASRRNVERFHSLAADPSGMLAAFREHLTGHVALARRHAGDVVVALQGYLDPGMLQPGEEEQLWLGRLGSPRAAGPPCFVTTETVHRLFRLVGQVGRSTADALGVMCVDLEAVGSSLSNYYDGVHFSARGAEVAAGLIVDGILRAARSSHASGGGELG
jgi:hypothetical protein